LLSGDLFFHRVEQNMKFPRRFRFIGAGQSLIALTLVAACSSSGGSNVAAGGAAGSSTMNETGGSGGASPIGNEESCDHVLVRFPDLLTTPEGLAVSGGKIYVTTSDTGVRVVSEVAGGAFHEVGRVPNGDAFILGPSALGADADALYLDVVQGSDRALMRLPLAGGDATLLAPFKNFNGFNSPPFLTDAQYAYFEQIDATTFLSRVPLSGPPSEKVHEDAFYGDGYTAIGSDDKNVYVAVNDLDAGQYSLSTISKTPDDSRTPISTARYTLGACTGAPANLLVDNGTVYLGCEDLALKLRQIYALAPAAAESMNTATLVQKGTTLEYEHFAIQGGNLYFADQSHINRVPLAGGTPTVVLATYGIGYLTTDDKSLYVAGDCGVQQADL